MDTPKIYAAMINVLRDIKAIGKDKKATGYASFNYRGIDDVYNALNPVMAQHGVFCVPELIDSSREERTNQKDKVVAFVTAKVRYTFYTEDGSSVSCVVAGEGMDSGDKATPKALSIAMKYALFQTFCIPTEELVDPDAETDRLAPKSRQSKQEIQHVRQQAVAENTDPPTPEMSRALMATLTAKGCKERSDYLKELSSFFGRDIKSSKELTRADISEYLNACKTPDNPF